jgi:hypothetical protein
MKIVKIKPSITSLFSNSYKRIALIGSALIIVGLIFLPSVVYQSKLLGQARTVSALPHYGIAAGSSLSNLTQSQLDDYMAGVSTTGSGWVRFDIDWDQVQPTDASSYDWSSYDRIVSSASSHHLLVTGILDFTPAWARSSACSDVKQCAPSSPAAFATFAEAASTRYSQQGVHVWEIWNEANTDNFWKPAPSVKAYSTLLIAASVGIHKADSHATVLSAGTAPADTSAHSISPVDFLNGLYANGAQSAFDAVSAHPYTYPLVPSNSAVRSVMLNHNDGLKKIWITEFGAPTGGPGISSTISNPNLDQKPTHVDEALEAKILTQAAQLYRSYNWVGPFFWYSYQDAGTTSDTNENFFGLVRADNSHKPAYDAFVAAVKTKM